MQNALHIYAKKIACKRNAMNIIATVLRFIAIVFLLIAKKMRLNTKLLLHLNAIIFAKKKKKVLK